MNCFVCESAGYDGPAQAVGLINGKPVCEFHASPIGPRPTPLPEQTDNTIQKGTPAMTGNGKLDANAVRADLASGMTVAAVAVKYGRAASTIRHYVPRNGAKPSRAAKQEAGSSDCDGSGEWTRG